MCGVFFGFRVLAGFCVLAGQHSAGGKDVFPARSPDCAGDAVMVQTVAECLHCFLGGALVREVGNPVETDEINPAFQAPEKADEGVGVAFVVVPAGEHGVFEAHPALAGEIVATDKAYNVFFVPGLLHGHEGSPFFGERIVEAHRQMAALLVEILLERGKQAYRAHRDALGTPAEAPGGGENLQHLGHCGIVVQRLPPFP